MKELLVCAFSACAVAELWASDKMGADPDSLFRAYTIPLWAGTLTHNETVMFVGENDKAPLLYPADEILSVRSFDLKTVYEAGKDWVYDRKENLLRRTPDSKMPYFTEDEYYPPEKKPEIQTFGCTRPGKPYILFAEGGAFSSRQIAVTYRHQTKWEGAMPTDESAAFAPLMTKLRTGMAATVVFYGDSITTGANSSKKINIEPQAPGWPELVHEYLKARFKNPQLTHVNTAKGGVGTQWGIDNAQALVIDQKPDLVLVAFGMNDMGYSAEAYCKKVAELVDKVRAQVKDVYVLLVPPMLPNKEVDWVYRHQPEFEAALRELVKQYRAAGVTSIGLADVTTMYGEVLKRKRYYDMTGNNVNHPNDFTARIYTGTILAALLGNDYTEL